MSELPINKTVTLRYISNLLKDITLVHETGGMYATAQDDAGRAIEVATMPGPVPECQKWQLIPKDRGVLVQLASDWRLIVDTPPVDFGVGWHNSSASPDTPITLSDLKKASLYYINVVTKIAGGWIVTVSPMGNFVGLDYNVGLSKNGKCLEIMEASTRGEHELPGWFVQETD